MERIIVQQGDCILFEVNSIPKTAKRMKIKGGSFVVLRGEGVNTHELQSATLADDIEAYMDGDTLYLKAKKDIPLVHQEHGTTVIEGGSVLGRRIEREFDYESMEARNVQD